MVVANAANTTNAYIGANADVRSGGDVLVTSTITDKFKTLAVSDSEEAEWVSFSASVAYGKTVDTANAYIADGAKVSAANLIDVSASTTVPNPASWEEYKSELPSDFWGWFQSASDLEGFLQDAVTSYVRSAAKASDDKAEGKLAVSGSVNILTFENTANAYIGAGAQINQDTTYAASPEQTVKVESGEYDSDDQPCRGPGLHRPDIRVV